MKWLLMVMSLVFAFENIHAKSGLLPEFDKRCNFMSVSHAEVSPHKYHDHEQYFNKIIPSRVHQIWFGDQSKKPMLTSKWEDFSKGFKFEYTLWTDDSLDEAAEFVSPRNMRYIKMFLKLGNYWAASDIMRFEILKHLGGIYVDCDFSPPHFEGKMIDLRVISPTSGLTVVTEHKGRDVGESAIFVCNGFIMAPVGHPVIVSVVEQLDKNIKSWHEKTGTYDAMFITGPFFFNKVLFGSYTVIPLTYLNYFSMY